MSREQPGLIRRFFRFVWDAVNFTRRLVFNVIFVIIVVAILVTVFKARPLLDPRTALVLNPKGAIVEQFSSNPAQRALSNLTSDRGDEVQLRDLLRVIDAATRDKQIERIVLVPDDIQRVGFATLRDIGAALDRFKASGKEIVAVSEGMNQSQYLLAAHANRILLDPNGSVLLEGLANYRSYFKDALDKLGVDVHLIRVGTFKSADEPYILNQASDAAKQADSYWMGGIWQDYLAEVASLRKIDVAAISDDIAHYDERVTAHAGDLARLAVDEKLVDQLATREEANQQLRSVGVSDGNDSFRRVDFKHYLSSLGPDITTGKSEIAVVVAQGEIVSGEQRPGMIGGDSTAQLVHAARLDKNVKAVVLRVDSPGGDAVASELIRREVEQTRSAGKPVIVSMGDVAASGGYWIAMDGDEIWAQPNTITGSIGIFGLVLSIPRTLDKLGIHVDGVGTTPLAGGYDIRRPLPAQLETVLNSVIRRGYDEFVGKVAKARGKTPEQIDAIAQGRVWTGAQAKDRGLVDKLGGLDDAIAAAAARAKLGSNYSIDYVEKPLSTWERIAVDFGNSEIVTRAMRQVGLSIPLSLFKASEIEQVASVVASLRGKRYAAFAQCFCTLD